MPTILVADDDRAFCLAMRMALKRRGYRVVVAHDMQGALDLVAETRAGFGIVDLHMGKTNGLKLIAELLSRHPGMALVLLTAQDDLRAATAAVELGALAYLTKPAKLEDVLAVFEN